MHPSAVNYLKKLNDEQQYPAAQCAMGDDICMYNKSASLGVESMNQANSVARERTAVDVLNVEDAGAFSARYSELRGDIAVARGDWSTARSEYEIAISDLGAGVVNRELIEIKLNDLPQASLAEVESES